MLKLIAPLLSFLIAPFSAHAQAPMVATDIAPVYVLVQAVMSGVGTPEIIMSPGASPHSYSMRPSEAFALENASLVFWIGDNLTPWLTNPISTLAPNAKIITLANVIGTKILPLRSGTGTDPHIWLDPQNALIWLDVIAKELANIDPDHGAQYRENAQRMQGEIQQVTDEILTGLTPIRGLKYLTYHDSFQYFETAFTMPAFAWILAGDAAPAGARNFINIQTAMTVNNITCIISEPGASEAILANIAHEDTFITEVDPLGNDPIGQPETYPQLLKNIAMALHRCAANNP